MEFLPAPFAVNPLRLEWIDLAVRPLQVAVLHVQKSGADVFYEAVSAEALALRQPGSYNVATC